MNGLEKDIAITRRRIVGLNIIYPLTRFISFKYRQCSILAINKTY